ncbi:MAG: DUF3365 domain-containing protein, partial [Cyanobacteria bacterium J06600_6]
NRYNSVILFVTGIAIAISSMLSLSTDLIESQALQSSQTIAQTLQESRSLYSAQVVNRIKNLPGIQVTHDYPGKPGAIPIPATYLIELSHNISEKNVGTYVRLYSKYPFPWRQAEGGARDDFEKEALQFLERNPQKVFHRVENINGNPTLRYAQPDIMKASCVACHNSHPDSPKRDWQVGQLRGILEIQKPLDSIVLQSRSSVSKTSVQLAGISVLAVIGLALVLARLKFINQELDILVKKRTSELNTANNDLETAREEVTQLMIRIDQDKRQQEVDEIVDCTTFEAIAKLGQKWRQDNQT